MIDARFLWDEAAVEANLRDDMGTHYHLGKGGRTGGWHGTLGAWLHLGKLAALALS
jgi:hypothetical protein